MLKVCHMYDLLLGFLGGMVPTLLFHAGLVRRVWNLQCDLATTQAQLLRERNQRASLSRSKDKEALEVLNELKGPVGIPKPAVNPLAKFGVRSGS